MRRLVVWIDDDAYRFPSVRRLLLLAGLEVIEYHSIAEVLSGVDRCKGASLVLLDLVLPSGGASGGPEEYPGLRLLQRLRKEFRVTAPAIVFSVAPETAAARAMELGIVECVAKWDGLNALEAAIKRYVVVGDK